jgi:hypothetical protein
MGAFQEGFRMGQSAYDDAQRLRLQQADEARRQQAFEQQQKLTDRKRSINHVLAQRAQAVRDQPPSLIRQGSSVS